MFRLRFLLPVLSFGVISCALLGCDNDPHSTPRAAGTGPHQQTADEQREAEESRPPYAGMTKEQALGRYGRPKSVVITDQGERWTYFLNEGEVVGKSLIPFYIPPRPRFGFLTFGANGTVKDFRWDAHEGN